MPVSDPSIPLTSEATAPARKHGTKRILLLLLLLAAALTAAYFSPLRSWLRDPARVRQAVAPLGRWIYPVGMLSIAALVGCGVPRLLLCTIAGMILGFWGGLLVGEVGTVTGYYALFLFVRWGGRDWALHRWPRLHKWAELARDQGIIGVILLRQMPIHGTLTNLGLGISRLRQRQFLIGTAIGIIPESIPATLVGVALAEGSADKGSAKAMGGWLALAAVIFAVTWLVCSYALRKMRARRDSADLLAEEAALAEAPDTAAPGTSIFASPRRGDGV